MKNSNFRQLEQRLAEIRECINRAIEDLNDLYPSYSYSEDARDTFVIIKAELYDLRQEEFHVIEMMAGNEELPF